MPWVDDQGDEKTEWFTGSSGGIDCCRQLCQAILCGTLCAATGCLLCLGVVTVIVSVPMIVIGGMYVRECHSEPMIPVYLLLGGLGILLSCCFNCCFQCGKRKLQQEAHNLSIVCSIFLLLVNLLMLAWFILGCVLIYKTFDSDMITDPDYDFSEFCNKTAYLFAFWVQTTFFILFFIIIASILALCLCKVSKCCC